MKKLTADEYRKIAADCRKRSDESFQRSDTDGFLSQWAADMSAMLYDKLAELAENNWTSQFPAIFDLETGNLVQAKLVKCRSDYNYNGVWKWMVYDDNGKALEWITNGPRALKKAGYRIGYVEKPAYAKISSHGKGLSGCASAFIEVYEVVKR